MLITESRLRKIIAEEYRKLVMQEAVARNDIELRSPFYNGRLADEPGSGHTYMDNPKPEDTTRPQKTPKSVIEAYQNLFRIMDGGGDFKGNPNFEFLKNPENIAAAKKARLSFRNPTQAGYAAEIASALPR